VGLGLAILVLGLSPPALAAEAHPGTVAGPTDVEAALVARVNRGIVVQLYAATP
jgi:hypothetical protein